MEETPYIYICVSTISFSTSFSVFVHSLLIPILPIIPISLALARRREERASSLRNSPRISPPVSVRRAGKHASTRRLVINNRLCGL